MYLLNLDFFLFSFVDICKSSPIRMYMDISEKERNVKKKELLKSNLYRLMSMKQGVNK